jgi:hypothetical protein
MMGVTKRLRYQRPSTTNTAAATRKARVDMHDHAREQRDRGDEQPAVRRRRPKGASRRISPVAPRAHSYLVFGWRPAASTSPLVTAGFLG